MATRTRQETVTFSRTFVVAGVDEAIPAGEYRVEIDEERIEGVSFPAYRRVVVMLHLHPSPSYPGRVETLALDPNELEAALARDRAADFDTPRTGDG